MANGSKVTRLHWAARSGEVDKVRRLLKGGFYQVDCIDGKGMTPLHEAAYWGQVGVVRVLISEFGANISARINDGSTVFAVAMNNHGTEELALDLMNEFHCDTSDGEPFIHKACQNGWVDLVRALVQKHGIGILHSKETGDTPLYTVAREGNFDILMMLINELDLSTEAHKDRSLLHVACEVGNVELVRALVRQGNADVTARDKEGNTPLHVAVLSNKEYAFLALWELGCDIHEKGHLGRSLLHSACVSQCVALSIIAEHISPWVVDNNGDTPLHICARFGHAFCVENLLKLDPPVLIRNNSGKIPRDLANEWVLGFFDYYMIENKDKIYSHYDAVQSNSKKRYSIAEPITRAFVIGNSGAGKSSLIEALKREGFVDSFKRVSESSVPPHTAGIIPIIHTSKHYGRVLFYDFAGDAEYYSSHAAILENLASSRKGDNIFILVIDLREEMHEIKKHFHYWLSFIRHQQFLQRKPRLIVVGSHLDMLTRDVAKARGKEFEMFCDSIDTEAVQMSADFMLDCCKPRSKQIAEIQALMSSLTKDSPHFKLSLQASILLGLLEKDFSNVPVCSTWDLLSHISVTGIQLPTEAQLLHPILLELHDLGLLFIVYSSSIERLSIVLNMSQLTNIVHKSLFSNRKEKENFSFSFSAGIIPQSILAKILPENITKECLVQLQYCQEISHAEAHVFPSLKVSNSTDQSFLFFPALCSADKSEVEWITPPDVCYGIGWLARCTDPCDYLSPRFHHVLILRLVFNFTLTAPRSLADKVSSGSPDLSYFQRRCTVWKTGVHWLMEEGVECMVELVSNKEVVVLTKSSNHREENCAAVFNDIVSCVMEAKAEFCHSVRLEFFLLDSTSEADYLSANNLFAMGDVERVLTSADISRAEVIVSATGKRQMERSKLLCLRNFTLWYSLFPMDFKSVLHYVKDVATELYALGLHLGLPDRILDPLLDVLQAHYLSDHDMCKIRSDLIRGWMSSSPDPPCWWNLVEALHAAERGTLAQKIAEDFGKYSHT